jgi:hypothetical protein
MRLHEETDRDDGAGCGRAAPHLHAAHARIRRTARTPHRGGRETQVLKKALGDGPEEDMPVRAVLRSQAPVTLYWCP